MSVELDTSGLKKLEKQLQKLSQRRVQEGFSGEHPSGNTNADIAYILEEGVREEGRPVIPPRPSFKDSIAKLKQEGFNQAIQLKYTEYLKGNIPQESFLQSAGELMKENHENTIKFWYVDGSSAKHNSPVTVKRKGFDRPLIEHGDLLKSLSYEVI